MTRRELGDDQIPGSGEATAHDRVLDRRDANPCGLRDLLAPHGISDVVDIAHGPLVPPLVARCKATNGDLSSRERGETSATTMERPEYPEIGARLRALREALEAETQGEFARRHGFNRSQVNNWETGVRRIPVDAAERLCDAYGLTLDWVYRGKRDGLSDSLRKVL